MRLAGIAELAEMLGVSRQRATQLAKRDDFPAPLDRLRMGPVWKRADLARWVRSRT